MKKLLDKTSDTLFKKPYSSLTAVEKNKVYYAIVESAGRDRASVTVGTKRLRMMGKVCLLITATLAVANVAAAENKKKEVLRQGAIIGGGLGGGYIGGLAGAAFCGPGALVCVVAITLLGSITGAILGETAVDAFDEELEEFTKWQIN
jgi:hypothetical protein